MKRLVIFLMLLACGSGAFGDWRFDGRYHWRGRQAYHVTRKSCGGYNYQKVYPKQSSYVSTVGDTISIVNNYPAYQPAAVQGSTLFGAFGSGYGPDLNLAERLAGGERFLDRSREQVTTFYGLHNASLLSAIELERQRGETARIVATGQSAAHIVQALQPTIQPVSYQAQTTVNSVQQYSQPGGPPPAPGRGGSGIDGINPLLAQYCATCHSRGGGTSRQDALQRFDMDSPTFGFQTRADGIVAAGRSLVSDDPARRMPLGTQIDDQTRGSLIQAWLAQ